jgi:LAS superfamily LD-carboxypeptidase LdcB
MNVGSRLLNEYELTGRARTHVQQYERPRFAAQAEVIEAFLGMRDEASRAGFELRVVSSFRDFKTQVRIWNSKFSGEKPLYDLEGQPRDFRLLSPSQVIDCILNWSALPGGSRHHWGTEIDVVDGAAMPPGYSPKLLPEEVADGGLFYELHRWLDENIARHGFFRPYKRYTGGMYPEPWHLSYEKLAIPAGRMLNVDLLRRAIESAPIVAKDLVLERIPSILENHIMNFVPPDAQRQ